MALPLRLPSHRGVYKSLNPSFCVGPCNSSRPDLRASLTKSIAYAVTANTNPTRANIPSGSSAYASSQQINSTVPAIPNAEDVNQLTARTAVLLPAEGFIRGSFDSMGLRTAATRSARAIPFWNTTRACQLRSSNPRILNEIRHVVLLRDLRFDGRRTRWAPISSDSTSPTG